MVTTKPCPSEEWPWLDLQTPPHSPLILDAWWILDSSIFMKKIMFRDVGLLQHILLSSRWVLAFVCFLHFCSWGLSEIWKSECALVSFLAHHNVTWRAPVGAGEFLHIGRRNRLMRDHGFLSIVNPPYLWQSTALKLFDKERTCIESEVGTKVVRTDEKDVHLFGLTRTLDHRMTMIMFVLY